MPDTKPGTDTLGQIQAIFATANFETNAGKLAELQHHCRVLNDFAEYCIDQIAINTPKTATNNVDWLAASGFEYNLTAYSAADKDAFAEIQRSAFQQELDSSHDLIRYKIVEFGFVAATGVNSRPSAFLSPVATKGGGGGGSTTPGYPPK
jgi:hypothetical protein